VSDSGELPRPILEGGQPHFVDTSPSSICSLGQLPLIMTGAMLQILRQQFADLANIRNSQLKDCLWTDDAKTTGIIIEPIGKWQGAARQAAGFRPALYVRRDAYKPVSYAIDDRHMGSASPRGAGEGAHLVDTGQQYELAVTGGHTIVCLGSAEAQAEALGTEVFMNLLEFSPLIQRELNLSKFDVTELSPARMVKEEKDRWTVPVTTRFIYQHSWVLQQIEPVFSGARFAL